MFTGLIETTGILRARQRSGSAGKLVVRPQRRLEEPKYGESIAINGVCLTLEQAESDGSLVFHTLAETLDRSNLGTLPTGATVNLERALRLGDRLGGHIVTGHVDATAPVLELRRLGSGDFELTVALPDEYAPLVVEKGSIAIDGVSLTVATVTAGRFSVCLIPVTLQDTALEARAPGTPVNLETDLLGKYVRRQLEGFRGPDAGITMATLHEAGFI